MTTIHMFKNHPNKQNIKFVVVPIVREVLHTCCDIAMNFNELVDKFGPDKEAACGINFDFSACYDFGIPQLW